MPRALRVADDPASRRAVRPPDRHHKRGGSPVPYTVELIKGILYARFGSATGVYEAAYAS